MWVSGSRTKTLQDSQSFGPKSWKRESGTSNTCCHRSLSQDPDPRLRRDTRGDCEGKREPGAASRYPVLEKMMSRGGCKKDTTSIAHKSGMPVGFWLKNKDRSLGRTGTGVTFLSAFFISIVGACTGKEAQNNERKRGLNW